MSLLTGRGGDLALEASSESWYPRRFGWSPLRALRSDRFKLIDGPRPELYDLASDTNSRCTTSSPLAAGWRRQWRAGCPGSPGTRAVPGPNPEILRRVGDERLSSLGYVARGSVEPVVPSPSQPPLNPKDHIAEVQQDRARADKPRIKITLADSSPPLVVMAGSSASDGRVKCEAPPSDPASSRARWPPRRPNITLPDERNHHHSVLAATECETVQAIFP